MLILGTRHRIGKPLLSADWMCSYLAGCMQGQFKFITCVAVLRHRVSLAWTLKEFNLFSSLY